MTSSQPSTNSLQQTHLYARFPIVSNHQDEGCFGILETLAIQDGCHHKVEGPLDSKSPLTCFPFTSRVFQLDLSLSAHTPLDSHLPHETRRLRTSFPCIGPHYSGSGDVH
jgi:hypothetical protein